MRRVLLAEDDAALRCLLEEVLVSRGLHVISMSDGRRLVERVAHDLLEHGSINADVIVADIRMPGFTGLRVARSLCRWPSAPPIVLMTAFPDAHTSEQARSAGVARLLAKPLDIDRFADEVERLASPRKRRVFVAEDDATLCRCLAAVLDHAGLEVTACQNGTDLGELIQEAASRNEAPDIIISDYELPGSNGLELLHLRQIYCAQTPFILATGTSDGAVIEEARQLGAKIVTKPYAPTDLVHLVDELTEESERT